MQNINQVVGWSAITVAWRTTTARVRAVASKLLNQFNDFCSIKLNYAAPNSILINYYPNDETELIADFVMCLPLLASIVASFSTT